MNHSPGPWKAMGNVVQQANDAWIASMSVAGRPKEESLANARLISTAPKMLKFLEAFVILTDDRGVFDHAGALKKAESIIKEATE